VHPLLHPDIQEAVKRNPKGVIYNPDAGYMTVATPTGLMSKWFKSGRHVGRTFFCRRWPRGDEFVSATQRITDSPWGADGDILCKNELFDKKLHCGEQDWRDELLAEMARNLKTRIDPAIKYEIPHHFEDGARLVPKIGSSTPTRAADWDAPVTPLFVPTPADPSPTPVAPKPKKPRAKRRPRGFRDIDF
jgi:hypothetical protein